MHHALQGGETEMGREGRETVREIFVDALPRTTSRSFRPAVNQLAGRLLEIEFEKTYLACLGQFARLRGVRRSLVALQHAIEEPDDKTVHEQNQRAYQTRAMPEMTGFYW